MLTGEQRESKGRFLRKFLIISALVLIPVLSYTAYWLLHGHSLGQQPFDSVLFFAVISVNSLALLTLLFLTLRHLAELFFERRHQIFGVKLRSKLILAFITLSFLPSTLLFALAFGSISTSMDYWFNTTVEESLQASAKMSQSVFVDTRKQAVFISTQLAFLLETKLIDPMDTGTVRDFFARMVDDVTPGAPDSIHVLDATQQEILALRSPRLLPVMLPPVASGALHRVAASRKAEVLTLHSSAGELVQAVAPVRLSGSGQTWFLVTSLLIPSARLAELQAIQTGLANYLHLVFIKAPMKLSLHILLVVVTLLIVFASIWLGIYISRNLTTPINDLALATRRVAEGDLNFQLTRTVDDEMGVLVEAFNAMMANLKASKQELEQAHDALQESTEVAEQRRNYLETILEHVPAGVITLDEAGVIRTINRFALDLLAIDPRDFVGHDFHRVLPKSHVTTMESAIQELMEDGREVVTSHQRLKVRRGEALFLQMKMTRMVDEQGRPMGFVLVFDDRTNLEQAQRLAAWQEVARRIAHEIKNPLTPIQLSAQRLKKRCLPALTSGQDVFSECTATIITQVDEIRKLVSEFSEFARMPKLKKAPGDLAALVGEVVHLYQQMQPQVGFEVRVTDILPVFFFDPVQIKRVLINLLDNAIAALENTGTIRVTLGCDSGRNNALLQVADNGPGIEDKAKVRIFEPYFSTRKAGTGLGLAICQTIVGEHNGSIRVADNDPRGCIFTVTLPLS